MYLDRLATNYVSFTLHEKLFMGKKNERKKDNFFKYWQFYDAIALACFICMYFAYPKSQSKIDNDIVKRKMLDICSELFTGTEIKSAKFDHWKMEQPGTVMAYKKKVETEEESLSLAEIKKKGNLRAKREPVRMKYSPLVERYLKAHKYETMNNV